MVTTRYCWFPWLPTYAGDVPQSLVFREHVSTQLIDNDFNLNVFNFTNQWT